MRGACNAILQLSASQRSRGVVTHSSGNFAQALALSAKYLGVNAYIIMPSNAPKIKKDAVAGYEGHIIECEPTLEAREATAEKVGQETGATFLHPYNDNHVIAGQGTAAKELLEDLPSLDTLIAPVGGGGLISGTALSAEYFGNNVMVFGGEPEGADDAYQSLKQGVIVPQTNPVTIADGLRTSLGDKTFPIIQTKVKQIILVSENEIIAAMRLIWERMKIVVEPSSAVALAAMIKEKHHFTNKKVGLIISGGNVDLGNLPF